MICATDFCARNKKNMVRVTIAKGDGIGPEIMDATLGILYAAGARIETDEIVIGEKVYLSGNSSGIAPGDWDTIRRNRIFLKSPITTPQGGGYKSLNVSTRKYLGLYANVRPCKSYTPFMSSKHGNMNVIIIRENEEDLYAGIEHRQTDEVVQCLKLISRPGCEKIVRYAFEYAVQHGRKKVSCFTKDNIMKQTDGLFHQVFKEIAAEYPHVIAEHRIVDIGAALLADRPHDFDVIVLPNLYGDILSDVAAQIAGSVGLAGSSNIGEQCAMFEAIHGSAPDIAGKNIANPSGLLNGAILMLHHIGQNDIAEKIENAWLKTIEEGIHTADIYAEGISTRLAGTKEFAEAVVNRLGSRPQTLAPALLLNNKKISLPPYQRRPAAEKRLAGVDVFVHWTGYQPEILADELAAIESDRLKLSMITNRGIKVWPDGFEETFCTDHWRCRFSPAGDTEELTQRDIIHLLGLAEDRSIETIKTENLYTFDGERGYSLGQGQ